MMAEKPGEALQDGLCPSLLAVSFRSPPGRWLTYEPDTSNILRRISGGRPGSSITGITLDGQQLYPEDSPLFIQPDLLVDFSKRTAVGFVFEITNPADEMPRAKRTLAHLGSHAIRLSEHGNNVDGRRPRRNVYYDNTFARSAVGRFRGL